MRRCIFFFTVLDLLCGCIPSKSPKIQPLPNTTTTFDRSVTRVDQDEERTNSDSERKERIAQAVNSMPEALIVFHHKRVSTIDYKRHNINNQQDLMIFRQAVRDRYRTMGEEQEIVEPIRTPKRKRRRNQGMIRVSRNHPSMADE
jgi:rhamnose utilization protein RhaD (predicted bifunctional aldolase and dehydrogenase)